MLTAIVIISLISLLVATEAEPGAAAAEALQAEPLRPKRGGKSPDGNGHNERLAA